MKPTDAQLQLEIAKLLPDKILVNHEGTLCHLPAAYPFPQVLETEMLHFCRLVEKKLKGEELQRFYNNLMAQCPDNESEFDYCVSASWRERATAIVKSFDAL